MIDLPITIAVQNSDGDWLTMECPWDSAGDELADAFRTAMFWLTFSPQTIDEAIPDPSREWGYFDEDENETTE